MKRMAGRCSEDGEGAHKGHEALNEPLQAESDARQRAKPSLDSPPRHTDGPGWTPQHRT